MTTFEVDSLIARESRRRKMLAETQVYLLRAARLARIQRDEGGAQLCEAAAKYLKELMEPPKAGENEDREMKRADGDKGTTLVNLKWSDLKWTWYWSWFVAWWKNKEPPCTPAHLDEIQADCWAADAHEDELFYAYSALCRKQGRDFDYEGFFRYAGEHWRMDYDAYGYRKSFLEGRRHPSAITLDSLRPKVPPRVKA